MGAVCWRRLSAGLAVFLCLCISKTALSEEPIEVLATLDKSKTNDHLFVRFTLENCGNKPVDIELGDLPWNLTFTTLLVNIGVGNFGIQIPRFQPPADFPSHIETIRPHQQLAGQVDLTWWFPKLAKVKDYSDIQVFWSYQAPLSNQQSTKLMGGMLTFDQVAHLANCKNI